MTKLILEHGTLAAAAALADDIHEHKWLGPRDKGGVYVHVYRNINRNCWSVRHKGKVIMLADCIRLDDCTFHIQPAGQKRVRKEGVKNVHAYIKGRLSEDLAHPMWSVYLGGHSQVKYNPYTDDTFMELYQTNTARYRHGIDTPEFALSPIKKSARHWSQVQFHPTGQVSGDPW